MKSKIIIAALFAVSLCSAQKFELGKASVEELQEKAHPKDPSADAAVLYSKGNTTMHYSEQTGFSILTEVETRIKIYNKKGYDWANKEIKYYTAESPGEKVSFSKAVTYNLVNGQIEKTKLGSEGTFAEKKNKYWSVKKITMPNVKEGSVIEYRYTIESPYITSLPEWKFQMEIPVNYSEFTASIPEYYMYNTTAKGFIVPEVRKETKSESIMLTSKERQGTYGGPTQFSTDKIDYIQNITTYVEKNLPAMRDENYVNNIDNYASSINYELAMSKFPNAPSKNYSTDWESVAKTVYDNESFGGELNKSGYFEDDLKALIQGMTSDSQKIAAIFNFVKTQVKWNEFYGDSCDDGVRAAYKSRVGNVAEINLMLTAMLRYAGIDANPVLISTRTNGIPMFPSRAAFNYVICAVEQQDAVLLLDATDPYALPGILPLRDLNWNGRLIRKDGTSAEIDLMPKTASKNIVFLNYTIAANGDINGKARKQFSDYEAFTFRHNHVKTAKDTYLEAQENTQKIEIGDYQRENDMDLGKPIVETYTFKQTKGLDIIGDKMYLEPFLFFAGNENPFKQEDREYPVDFGYPKEFKYNINVEIPAGYIIESMPAALAVGTQNKEGAFKYLISAADNKIQISVVQDINEAIIPSQNYKMLKDFFQKMIDKQTEKIVLKKA